MRAWSGVKDCQVAGMKERYIILADSASGKLE